MRTTKTVIYFYTPEIEHVPKNRSQAVDPKFYSTGLHHWVHFTYCYFKYINQAHPYNVIVTSQIPVEGIIFFHRGWFPADLQPTCRQLFVCMQVDYGKHRYAQIQVIHNPLTRDKLSAKSILDKFFSFTKDVFLPSWPQPGLIVRSSNRSHKIENICFMGHEKNLPKELRTEAWEKKCAELKVNFRIVSESEKWPDFSEVDLVLAMRAFGKKPYYNKPFLKVTNAIFAGTLVIATPESSHLYLKNDKKVDFRIVNSDGELADAIQQMKTNPLHEFKKVESNKELIRDYNFEGVFKSYETFFGECERALQRWSRASSISRFLYLKFRQLRFLGR